MMAGSTDAVGSGVPERLEPYNYPKYVPLSEYERVRDHTARMLAAQPGVLAVYQLGGISAPGISDLDMLAVFETGSTSNLRPRALLDATGRYLFAHGVFAVAAHHFELARAWTPFRNYQLLCGTELRDQPDPDLCAAPETLRVQVALEYLVDTFIARAVEAWYGLVDVRGMLLWGHGLRFDLQLLGLSAGQLADRVAEICEWRTRWFERPVRTSMIRSWFKAVLSALEDELDRLLAVQRVALPIAGVANYARHVRLVRSERIWVRHRGIVPSRVCKGKRFFRFLHRLNRFEFGVPCEPPRPNGILARRMELMHELKADRLASSPGFTPFVAGVLAKL